MKQRHWLWDYWFIVVIVGFGVFGIVRGDALGTGIDFGAAALLALLVTLKRREREQVRRTVVDLDLPPAPAPDWLMKGYEPVETPDHTDPGFGNPNYVPPGD